MTKIFSTRDDALDALRGIAILLMILSGTIPFAGVMPSWMYHAQVPPPLHKFDPSLPGITWVDLVFPFFLFAMGTAFPFALNKKISDGTPLWKIIIQTIFRGLALAFFAIFIQHIKPYALNPSPELLDWSIGLIGFAILFLIYTRIPFNIKTYFRYIIKLIGIIAAIVLLMNLEYPNGSGFSLGRSDIIILVLANVALFGSLIWIFTRNNMLIRLGLLGILLAFRLTQDIDGSWNHWLWNFSPFPWLYKLYYLQYLFIVIPGTIFGDMIYEHLKIKSKLNNYTAGSKIFNFTFPVLLFLILITNLICLYSRMILLNLLLTTIFILFVYFIFKREKDRKNIFVFRAFNWGTFWLILGLFFEAYEGGIKKDHATLSYYFVTTGLAIYTYFIFTYILNSVKKFNPLQLLIENGRNPMIAYVGASNIVQPIFGILSLNSILGYLNSNAWLGFIKGALITIMVAYITRLFSKYKLFWRT